MLKEPSIIPVLTDNYIFIIEDKETGMIAAIDPAQARPVIDFLEKKSKKLSYILNTHHHFDHVGGNEELKAYYGCKIVGFEGDADRIPAIDIMLKNGDNFDFGGSTAKISYIPGHTLGHIMYHFIDDELVFIGDTLFSMGCGRLFEGTYEQMYDSLQLIKTMPVCTKIYCTHEYSLANSAFATELLPQNKNIAKKAEAITKIRQKQIPTIPTILQEELAANPFLLAKDLKEFTKFRKAKDAF